MNSITALHDSVESLLRDVTARIIMPHYQKLTASQIEEKTPGDLVTVADKLSEEALCEGLEKIIPGLAMVGEEAVFADDTVMDRLSGDCWIIDPIDGTRNFASGEGPFGILIAMSSGGVAHTGWIYDCRTGRLCIAHKGKGAFIDGETVIGRTTGETPPVAALATGFLDDEKRAFFEQNLLPNYRCVPIPFCAAEQYPRLALGENDLSFFGRTLPWDHAAGALFLNEAGGCCLRADGSEYRVDEKGRTGMIGAASREIWEDCAKRISPLNL